MAKQKVVVVGTGMVGASYAYALVNQCLVDELVLIDYKKETAVAHAEDIKHGTCYLEKQPDVYAGEYSDCKDADIVCITAGAAQKPGQTRLDLVEINAQIMTGIVQEIMKSGFNGIILVASNPVDIMAYVAQKVSGLPQTKVFGSGTTLDTGRLRSNLSEYLGYNPTNIHAYIIGEHGDSSLPLWSTATVGQQMILDIVAQSEGKLTMEGLDQCFVDARDAAYKIIEGKGSTYFGIGLALARVTRAILSDQTAILTVSVKLNGEYGESGLYVPVPAIIGGEGISQIQHLNITNEELEKFKNSCNTIKHALKSIGYDEN